MMCLNITKKIYVYRLFKTMQWKWKWRMEWIYNSLWILIISRVSIRFNSFHFFLFFFIITLSLSLSLFLSLFPLLPTHCVYLSFSWCLMPGAQCDCSPALLHYDCMHASPTFRNEHRFEGVNDKMNRNTRTNPG